jgi:hypothetical protein
MSEQPAVAMGTVVPFPLGRQLDGVRAERRATGQGGAHSRLTLRDRVAALRWADAARDHGIARCVVHDTADDGDPDIGDVVLVYADEASWATWSVGCSRGTYTLWRGTSGAMVGRFPSLVDALQAIVAIAATALSALPIG